VCLELGCGVGRVTGFLAKRFDHVIAFDISQGNLDLAREHLSESGIRNVDLVLLRDLADIEQNKNFDFFYSVIVLQHNPPPVIAKLLRIIMAKLNSGGGFLFQIPTHLKGYEFIVEKYLLSHDPVGNGFEMHALPMHNVLEIIQGAGGCLKEVLADNWTGIYGSHTFFGVKPQDAHAFE
jgi:SAM-dependent methyltransferase